jgi:Holliday junction resolvase
MSTVLKKPPVNYFAVNKIRHSRGYNFESSLVADLNKGGFHARRLGGASSNLPDVFAVRNEPPFTAYAIEAKSITVGDHAYIPMKQIIRCVKWLDMFSHYDRRYLVFAFKFSILGKKSPIFYSFAREWTGPYQKDSFEDYDFIRCSRMGKIERMWTAKSRDNPLRLVSGMDKLYQVDDIPFTPKVRYDA